MRVEFTRAFLALLAASCSDSDPKPTLVTIETTNPPALVVFRDETSTAWRDVEAVGATTFEITTLGLYEVIVACEVPGIRASVRLLARSPADEPHVERPCAPPVDPAAVTVRGRMLDSGGVGLGDRFQSSSQQDWIFMRSLSPGTFDLVMVAGSSNVGFDQIAIRRDLVIAGETDLGTIDIAQEGPQPLIPMSFTATNLLPGESQNSTVILFAAGSFAFLHNSFPNASGWNVRVAPESILRPTDLQTVVLNAGGSSGSSGTQSTARTFVRDLRPGDPTLVRLPEPLGPVTFEASADRLAVTWSTLPKYDEVSLRRENSPGISPQARSHEIILTRAFVDATDATSTAIDFADVPGFKPEWRLDPAVRELRVFSTQRGASSSGHESAGVAESIAPTP